MPIERVRHLSPQQRQARAAGLAQVIASQGDTLIYRSKPGKTAGTFNALAEGLSISACQPGGVTAFGRHWCAGHDACKRAEAAAMRCTS